jgi:hypothetical protein
VASSGQEYMSTSSDWVNLLYQFQCDIYHFGNIKRRDPRVNDMMEKNLLGGICRANLYAFWARRSGMVKENLATIQ